MQVPDNLKYSREHEWAQIKENGTVRVGVTDYAQKAMGDVVFVELPQPGESFAANERYGSLESVKAVSECYMPVGGTVTVINEELPDTPELVNRDSFGKGWLVEIKARDEKELEELMTGDDYKRYVESLES